MLITYKQCHQPVQECSHWLQTWGGFVPTGACSCTLPGTMVSDSFCYTCSLGLSQAPLYVPGRLVEKPRLYHVTQVDVADWNNKQPMCRLS